MSVEFIPDCNGCAECIDCGRKNSISPVYSCDYCGDELTPDMLRRDKSGKDICLDCFLEKATATWDDLGSSEV